MCQNSNKDTSPLFLHLSRKRQVTGSLANARLHVSSSRFLKAEEQCVSNENLLIDSMIEGSPPLFLGEVAHSARGVYINFDTALFSSEIVSYIVVNGIG